LESLVATPFWSAEILDEATRNLVADAVMNAEQAERLREAMERAFPKQRSPGTTVAPNPT
jgi:hypothetical protein